MATGVPRFYEIHIVCPVGRGRGGGGLVLFFVCAVHTHLLARDYSAQFILANGFLVLVGTGLALGLTGT